eukprot:CAMPEP_0196762822 /NCGR_PEP_ID=MMETSP1095-20130614/2863_1 /TAXON_ID=96789 ORGANISM="Chromulina nebulosa, Strain UTEXLB2642" /NCGR_SAMPLE_ID=MMETSP1095 /ASSEMBLY_ACC=CAM_ASM_000446 /LENGTH=483 /DNA_ID=CAMNT_0042114725 /DNA_START=416 /DNA_END=1867 /DNA_ORIENTATION=-
MKNYYAQEVCSPSRAALLTGRYPASVGMQYGLVGIDDAWGLSLDETLLPQVLKSNGYTNYVLGKWHLGNYSPQYLPTARGFHNFTGILSGQAFHWSKLDTSYMSYYDFITSTEECYNGYTESDKSEYSTYFYTNKAKEIIESHAESDTPFFLYLPYQAVHNPFADQASVYKHGMPASYLPDEIIAAIDEETEGSNRRQYFRSLYKFDQAVGELYNTLVSTGLMDNTYVIFASDNGGCGFDGAFNGPLRGMKGSLFEGGIKVDSFIYSPLLEQSSIIYDNLFHVSDWFPTILGLAGISYTASDDKPLDGVDHSKAWFDSSLKPRTTLLYNIYKNVHDKYFNIWKNGSFAIRNEHYKLMHTFYNEEYDKWYEEDEVTNYDDYTVIKSCSQTAISSGTFTYYLFDLINDPYETTNLYESTNTYVVGNKTALYSAIESVSAASDICFTVSSYKKAKTFWAEYEYYALPWDTDYIEGASSDTYPSYCS